eukprot:TRINITY_DN264_c2_g1_i1.p1 TRINITY_DN264_c2_g1~~TRINITY_DN264_c2_g1_i1.p1  ORF type:complete len:186 (-),score=70.61 TRINITY_DN264_c2_g1_i1:850-1407(-)
MKLISLLTLLFLSLFVHGEETRLTNCDEEDTLEAKTAFKNCVDSSKAPILENTESFKESGLNSLCERLNNLFSTCEEERITLMECTSEAQVENVIEAHMTSIGDILESLLRDMDVKSCSVFNNEGRSDEEYFAEYEDKDETKEASAEDASSEAEAEHPHHNNNGGSKLSLHLFVIPLAYFLSLWK